MPTGCLLRANFIHILRLVSSTQKYTNKHRILAWHYSIEVRNTCKWTRNSIWADFAGQKLVNKLLLALVQTLYYVAACQWRNDGVAAASSDGAPTDRGPRQREKRPEEAPTWESDGGPGWLRYATAACDTTVKPLIYQCCYCCCIGLPIHYNYQLAHYTGFCRISRSILNRFQRNFQA